jgi:hypothetical protein
MMVNVLRKLDPVIARQRITEAAHELGGPKERYPFMLAAARLAQQLELESENPAAVKLSAGRSIPVMDDETSAALDDTFASQASNGDEVAELKEVHSLHATLLSTAEKSVGRIAESYDLGPEYVAALAATPADGSSK